MTAWCYKNTPRWVIGTMLTADVFFFCVGACIMTRAAVFLNRFFYKVWFFGACYYWGTWLFLAIYVIGLGVSVAKKRKSVVDEELDSSDDSDEELVPA
ncbi:putative lysosomal cobalamin transporter [Desmophyllum pertusum]|uniref:Lysosomal cobalamin transporter n=1 Tax=Desmophyllum pertusum TaxID=174260 RepID=A0A9W9Z2F9_9CNID|nr:putative lysosomal cobalamin transporter [Desmophyllum pertusum]